jgi:hypothetical protein
VPRVRLAKPPDAWLMQVKSALDSSESTGGSGYGRCAAWEAGGGGKQWGSSVSQRRRPLRLSPTSGSGVSDHLMARRTSAHDLITHTPDGAVVTVPSTDGSFSTPAADLDGKPGRAGTCSHDCPCGDASYSPASGRDAQAFGYTRRLAKGMR